MLKRELLKIVLVVLAAPLSWAQSDELPAAPVQAKVNTVCTECHQSRIIVQQRLSKATWTKEVDKMVKWGAIVDPADRDAFVDYLSTNFPADKAPYVAPKTATQRSK